MNFNAETISSKWAEIRNVAVPNAGQLLLTANEVKIYCTISLGTHLELVIASHLETPNLPAIDSLEIIKERNLNFGWVTVLRLKPNRFEFEFATLCADICNSVQNSESSADAFTSLQTAYESWIQFYKKSNTFGIEAARGLFGELAFIEMHLSEKESWANILSSWQGPRGGHHDFVFENSTAVEIKTIHPSSNEVQISSEFQLQFHGDLKLWVIRVLDSKELHNGRTLNDLVNAFEINMNNEELDFFRALLNGLGFQTHLSIANDVFFEMQDQLVFDANHPSFPKITPTDLAPGLTKVKYKLALSALTEFETEKHT